MSTANILFLLTCIISLVSVWKTLLFKNAKHQEYTLNISLSIFILSALIFNILKQKSDQQESEKEKQLQHQSDSVALANLQETLNSTLAVKSLSEFMNRTMSSIQTSADSINASTLNLNKKATENFRQSHKMEQQVLDETKKNLYPISDSMRGVAYFTLPYEGVFKDSVKKSFEKAFASGSWFFSVDKNCAVDTAGTNIDSNQQKVFKALVNTFKYCSIDILFMSRDGKMIKYTSKPMDMCKEVEGFGVSDKLLAFSLQFELRRKEGFNMASVYDLRNSVAEIQCNYLPSYFWDWRDSATNNVQTSLTLQKVQFMFDEHNNIFSPELKVDRGGKKFYISNVKFYNPKR